MAETVTVVCFANAAAVSGRWVAAKRLENDRVGSWIRPVIRDKAIEVADEDVAFLLNSRQPRPLDFMNFVLLEPRPAWCWSENFLIDRNWVECFHGSMPLRYIDRFLDDPEQLWVNGHDTLHGSNDRIPEERTETLTNSLALIRVETLVVRVVPSHPDRPGPPRVTGSFSYRGERYVVGMRDSFMLADMRDRGEGAYPMENCYLTIGLIRNRDGSWTKVIGGVIGGTETAAPI